MWRQNFTKYLQKNAWFFGLYSFSSWSDPVANVDLCWSSRVRANANNLDIISGNNPKSCQGFFMERAIQTMLILIFLTIWAVVTDGKAEIICASTHPNRQAGNFRPWENKLACFTHSSQSGEWGGRENETDRQRQNTDQDKRKRVTDRKMTENRRKLINRGQMVKENK